MERHLTRKRGPLLRTVLPALAAAMMVAMLAVAAANGASGATVQTRSTSLGKIIVDAKGRTLYLFEKEKAHRSSCSGQCAKFWPPLLATGKPTAAAGAKASLLGTTRRSNGAMQVTYAGHPLYRFLEDKKPRPDQGRRLESLRRRLVRPHAGGKRSTRADEFGRPATSRSL